MRKRFYHYVKRVGVLFLAVAVVVTAVPVYAAAVEKEQTVVSFENMVSSANAEGKNIMQNGGFELGTSSWSGRESAVITAVTEDKVSGSKSLKVTSRKNTGAGPEQDVTGQIKNSDVLTVSASVKYTTGPDTRTYHVTANFNGTAKNLATATIEKGKWCTIASTYTVPSDVDVSSVKIFVETSWVSSADATNDLMDFYVDDVVIRNASLKDENALVYFVDCGDYVVSTTCSGDDFGTHNSVTDQVFKEDSLTGYEWGIVDTVSTELVNGSSNTGGVDTDHTWPYEFNAANTDTSSKTDTNRYTRNIIMQVFGILTISLN